MLRTIGLPLLLCGLVPSLHAQFDADELLHRAMVRVRDTVDRLPNYICTQTMERSETWGSPRAAASRAGNAEGGCDWLLRPDPARFPQTDRVRVDVLFTSAGERYSWAGSNQFRDRDLLHLVPIRAISTGGFSGFLRSIFATGNVFAYRGDSLEGGRKLPAYSFRVPRERSEYWFGTGSNRRIVACEGTFLLDPETADLVSLAVRSSDPPEATGACRATTALSYSRARLGDSDFLLPTRSVFEFMSTRGEEARNISVYSDCHEFRGDSTLQFGPPDPGQVPVSKPAPRPVLTLPEGLLFRIAFAEDISYRTAAAGDTFAAKLTTHIQDRFKEILVPVGTPVVARILDADSVRVRGGIAHLIFRLETLTMGGVAYGFVATSAQRVESDDPFDDGTYKCCRNDKDVAALVLATNTAILKFYGIPRDFVLKAGKQSTWRTGGTGPTLACLNDTGRCK